MGIKGDFSPGEEDTMISIGYYAGKEYPSPFCAMADLTGITIANAEKRDGDAAHFRIQCYGDAAHLRENGEALSQMAAFSPIFQG